MAGIIEVKDQGKLRIYDADNSHYTDIVVPSSVTANRTITLPDASFTVPTADTVGGITMADQWRLTTTFAGDTTAMQNLERVDTKSPGFIGTAMSESAGIFTFPSTGIYSIFFNVCGSATTAQLYHTCAIQVTTDGSNYATAASNDINYYGGTSYGNSLTQYVFDVTSTSTHKVRFNIDAVSTSTNTLGNSNETQTGMTFIRLGDT